MPQRETLQPPQRQLNPERLPEVKYFGIHTVLAAFKLRPQDIIRVHITEAMIPIFKELLGFCARTKRAYSVVTESDMQRIAGSDHHQGICMIIKAKPRLGFDGLLARLKVLSPDEPCALLFLDQTENPHNVGAIVRTAAHFGVDALLGSALPRPAGALARVSEGGVESVAFVGLDDPIAELTKLKTMGFCLVALDGKAERNLFSLPMPARVVLMMGHENHGLSPATLKLASTRLRIPGTGQIESLNVSVASALALAEWARNHGG